MLFIKLSMKSHRKMKWKDPMNGSTASRGLGRWQRDKLISKYSYHNNTFQCKHEQNTIKNTIKRLSNSKSSLEMMNFNVFFSSNDWRFNQIMASKLTSVKCFMIGLTYITWATVQGVLKSKGTYCKGKPTLKLYLVF